MRISQEPSMAVEMKNTDPSTGKVYEYMLNQDSLEGVLRYVDLEKAAVKIQKQIRGCIARTKTNFLLERDHHSSKENIASSAIGGRFFDNSTTPIVVASQNMQKNSGCLC